MVGAVADTMSATLPLGRKLIRVTVDPPDGAAPLQRGHRRVGWIESAVGSVRAEIGDEAYERLVSALAVVVGWEAFVVLADVRGLEGSAASAVVGDTALAVLDAARSIPRVGD